METFIQRIIDEKKDLDERIGKLKALITSGKFKNLEPTMRALMEEQYFTMDHYSQILEKRLYLLNFNK